MLQSLKHSFVFGWMIAINSYCCIAQQGINNHWIRGYDSEWGVLPFGINRLDFINGSPIINYDSLPMEFRHTHANISDAQGNLLFYTNGYYIADATHDTMMNGSGINPGAYANFVPDGFLIPQGALIIPKPGSNNLFYLFHSTADNYPSVNGSVAYQLYLSIIDMNLNNGLGAVTLKNYPIISDTLNIGKLTATKHANGRDWWVVCHRVNSNKYYKLLVTPFGLPTVSFQNIGSFREWDAGQAKFSPDGKKFAYYHYRFTGLDIFDFDRCSGMFSNWINDSIPAVPGNVGCEFSANSEVLYVTNVISIYQYNLTSTNVLATKMMVAVWDTFYDPFPPVGTYLCYPQLAPDGKIYITTGNSTRYMHRIENPDVVGVGCNVNQHSVQLPAYYFNTIPNHPNYFLGCDTTCTPCLVGLTLGPSPKERGVTASPNPSNGVFTLQFDVQSTAGELLIYDVNGRMVYKDYIAPWSQFKRLDMRTIFQPAGIYLCRLQWGERSVTVKVVVEE